MVNNLDKIIDLFNSIKFRNRILSSKTYILNRFEFKIIQYIYIIINSIFYSYILLFKIQYLKIIAHEKYSYKKIKISNFKRINGFIRPKSKFNLLK